MLCAATIDLNDYTDPASLQQALASLPHTPAEVPRAKPHSVHNMHVL